MVGPAQPAECDRAEPIAARLYAAMKGAGTDEAGLYAALGDVRSDVEWVATQRAFLEKYPERVHGNLRRAIAEELSEAEMQEAHDVLHRGGVSWDECDEDVAARGEDPEVTAARLRNRELLAKVREHNSSVTPWHVRRGAAHRRVKRAAMDDVVDTVSERLHAGVQQNWLLNKMEAKIESYQHDKVADAITAIGSSVAGGGEAEVEWGTRWKPIGEEMELPDGGGKLRVDFGDAMRRLYFNVPPTYLAGGRHGATPRPVQAAREMWNRINQVNPVMWRFKSLPLRLMQAEARVSELLHSDPDDTVMVLNRAFAVSAVLRGLPWEPGDSLLLLSSASGAQRDCAAWLRRRHGVELMEVAVPHPYSDDAVVAALSAALAAAAAGGRVPKVACLDHVTPREGHELPARRLCTTLRERGVSVLVDGTFAIGVTDVWVGDVGADWYVGAAHSMLYTCPGVGFLVAAQHKHPVTETPTVSYFDGQGYAKEFKYYGLQCWSTWCAVIEAVDFANNVCGGYKEIREYCNALAARAAAILQEAWGTEPLNPPGKTRFCVIPLPTPPGATADAAAAAHAEAELQRRGATVEVFAGGGSYGDTHERDRVALEGPPRLYARCVAQVWNTDQDFRRLAAAGREMYPSSAPPAAAPGGGPAGPAAVAWHELLLRVTDPTRDGDHTLYQLVLYNDGVALHSVSRRFRDFHTAFTAVARRAAADRVAGMPGVPPKKFFGRFDPGFIEDRRRRVESFLAAAVVHPSLRGVPELRELVDVRGAERQLRAASQR